MKRVILAVALTLLIAGAALGQGGDVEFIESFTFTICTDDSLTDSTFYTDMHDLGVIGSLLYEVIFDSIDGFPDGLDSTMFRYRHVRRISDGYEPYLESDGTEKDYSYLQIYNEGSNFGNFDWDVMMADDRAFWCAVELGTIPWKGAVGLNVQHADSNTTPADTGKVYINVYKSKN